METRPRAKSFRELIVWQKAHAFVLDTYILTRGFPKEELYGVTSQLRRAAVSIAAYIAEGFKKKSRTDKARYFNIAQGSAEECKYCMILVQDLGYADSAPLARQLEEVSRLLEAYSRSLLAPET